MLNTVISSLVTASVSPFLSYLQTDFDSKVTPYLIKELLRILNKEKTWRARLWRNGIVRSSSMSPREQPQYVGVEEVYLKLLAYLLGLNFEQDF